MRAKITLCLLVLAGATATGFGQAPARPNLYPLKQGCKWHYRLESGDKSVACTMHIAKLEKIDGQDLFRLEMIVNGKVLASENLACNDKGVFRTGFNDQPFDKPLCLIQYPVKAGASWEETIQIEDQAVEVKAKVGAETTIQVPAGKFKAIPVRIEVDDPQAGAVTTTYWFAADVGIVKQTIDIGGDTLTLLLEKHEPVR